MATESPMTDKNPTMLTWKEERYKAWCALNEAGIPIAASVRNNEKDVPGDAVVCLITVRKHTSRHDAGSDKTWEIAFGTSGVDGRVAAPLHDVLPDPER